LLILGKKTGFGHVLCVICPEKFISEKILGGKYGKNMENWKNMAPL
jgi:hypothetical protein